MYQKTVQVISSLVEIRRYIRSIQLSTEKTVKEISYVKLQKKPRSKNSINDAIRAKLEKIYTESITNLKLLDHVQITIKTHLFENTRLVAKMSRQVKQLIVDNTQTQTQTEELMNHYIESTVIKDDLTLIRQDITKKLSKNFNVEDKTIYQKEQVLGVTVIQSNNSTDKFYCVLICGDKKKFKTFYNELPLQIDDVNFIEFQSPSQAVKQILDIMKTDGFF